MPQSLFTRRYYIDSEGERVLIGLTAEQTREFELLEALDRLTLIEPAWAADVGSSSIASTSRHGKSGEPNVPSLI